MRILLIGGKSYVGQSLMSIYDKDIVWVSISRYDLESRSVVKLANKVDAIVVIATPARTTSGPEWILDEKVSRYLIANPIPKICISSIRADDDVNEQNKYYINALRRFEELAIGNGWQTLRISNFLGLSPNNFPNQKRLLLFPGFTSEESLILESIPNQLTEWVSAEDVVAAIKIILNSSYSEKFVTRPSFEITLSKIVDLMILNFRTSGLPLDVKFGLLERPKIITAADDRLSKLGWKTKVTTETLLEKFAHYYKQESIKGG